MKRPILILALLTFISLHSYCQIAFEKGYFIDNTDKRIECLIKNLDWKNNPKAFDYKLSENESVQTASIENVKEFGIAGASKFKRATVKIDRSSDHIENLGSDRNPVFVEEQLFLKQQVEGKASLFSFEDTNLIRFFYQLDNSSITQLVYKKYKSYQYINENNLFRQQLFMDLKCDQYNNVNQINYTKRDLKNYFVRYNKCADANYVEQEPAPKKDMFNLSLRAGLNYTNFTARYEILDVPELNFGYKPYLRLGVETEMILPFNKDKWSIIAEPTYQSYRAEKQTPKKNVSGGVLMTEINYQAIGIPIGVRHYFFLNKNSKIFANLSYVFNLRFNSKIDFKRSDGSSYNSEEINPKNNLALGGGYKYRDRYLLEFRYTRSPDLLSKRLIWETQYQMLSVILGYTLF